MKAFWLVGPYVSVRALSEQNARNTADNTTHRQFASLIGKEDFTHAGSAIVPAFQYGHVFHKFQRGFCIWRGQRLQ